MYKLKLLLHWLTNFYTNRIFKNKNVLVVSGLRRSGNHACISWISAAIIGEKVDYKHTCHKVYQSPDESIIHLNEVNFLSLFDYAFLLQRNKHHIEKARTVIISLEDYVPKKGDMYYPRNAVYIKVKRDILTTIASRITYNVKRAKKGIDRGDMHIDSNFFDIYRVETPNEIVWDYSMWQSNFEWRKMFLTSLGLEKDISVGMSLQGAGSSFHDGDNIRAMEMSDESRWNIISWDERVKSLISKNIDLLNLQERQYFKKISEEDRD